MVSLLKEVYGLAEFNKYNGNIQWDVAATPEQGANECRFYILMVCCTYDGEKFVEKIKKKM
jgi:hypothetical protein